MPEGTGPVFLPAPYSPELQPAQHLWGPLDEAVVNRHFPTLADLDAAIAERRCHRLDAATIKPRTDFHWWPRLAWWSRSTARRGLAARARSLSAVRDGRQGGAPILRGVRPP